MTKFYSRVPSKRVAMASRKVFCGARRPFITGIVTLVWDRQQLAEGHTIPGAQWAASMRVSGMAGRHCGDSSPESAPGICFYSHSAPQDPGHGLARLLWLITTPAGGRFRCRKISTGPDLEVRSSAAPQSAGSHRAQVEVTEAGCSSSPFCR